MNQNNSALPIIYTQRLTLRAVQQTDAEDIFEYAGDQENTRFMSFETHKDINVTHEFIRLITEKIEQGICKDFVFELKQSGKVIGAGGAFSFGNLHCAEIGYILNKRYWGMGLAAEAMRAIIDYLFSLGVHRIEAYHNPQNVNSGKVMQKLGMTYEGIMKDKAFVRGQYVDAVYYAIINPNIVK